ncbi:MAG: 4-aminobutyrate aminotransferase [Symbiobacteriaceae bacterium]|jgi:4-aminobutyrate aminotransferase/(S)-3-amino-2-methylpropionate transaminase|nr:4-aminobutyrate aminotransferase [Symbiobacteriaceae bacterium]
MSDTKSIRLTAGVPGPISKELMAKKDALIADAFSIHVPVAIKEAHGALVTDVDGNVFIDLCGGLGCMNVGHSHPHVVKAIQESAAQFTHTDFSVIMYDSYLKLAERLIAKAPGAFAKKACFFNAGAEAVENAIKFARKFTGRQAIIALEGAFHGRTNLTMSLTSKVKPYKEGFGPFAPEIYRVPAPYTYRRPTGMTEAEYVKFCGDALERALITHVAPSNVAAIIVEPVQGEGGFVPLHPDYLAKVQELAKKHGFLVIADEIQAGFGRTGTFFASEQLGLVPDLICVGKSIAVGLPLSGVIGRKDVMDAPGDSAIGGTYVGNPVACAAANAVLDVIESEKLTERANEIGDVFRKRFGALANRLEGMGGARIHVGEVRGLGAMIGMELVRDLATKEPASAEINAIMEKCINRGVIIVKCGYYGQTLRMLVPLVITMEQLAEALDVLEQAIVEVASGR